MDNMRFEHFIVTRFNLPLGSSRRGLDEDWLRHRLGLFERFCLPSVLAQTERSFRWMLLLDTRTPAPHRARIERLARDSPLRPLYFDTGDREAVVAALRAQLSADTTHLISTTLDNDDAISRDFVARIQARFSGQALQLLNFTTGYRLRLQGFALHACRLQSSPFMTAIERADRARTITGYLPHSTLADRMPIVDVEAPPCWLQVVHERNLSPTGFVGRLRVPASALPERFAVEVPPGVHDRWPMRMLENLRRRVERRALDSLPATRRRELLRLISRMHLKRR